MEIKAIKSGLEEIKPFRVVFLQESNFQFIYNKCHDYGWADTYLFFIDDTKVGYGAVWGMNRREDRDAIFEFYIINSYRKFANAIFAKFHAASGATFIECQSNDLLLTAMLYEYAQNINAEAILFEDSFQTNFSIPNTFLQKRTEGGEGRADNLEYVLNKNDETVASGGLMLNYNMPYADIYYEVKENHRRKGFGTLIVQELKNEAYKMGRVPAARCNINNIISKSVLLKAGFQICGHRLNGEIKKNC
jgi:RimJ/RimL family protein N-acetyltransferase